jgi:hypothetical protein
MNVSTFTFRASDAAADAVHELRRAGVSEIQVMSPVPHHRLEEAAGTGASRTGPVHWFALAGAVAGCTAGWALTVLCSLDYPMVTSGRAIVLPHVYLIIAYELTLLTAIVMTLVGFLSIAELPRVRRAPYHPVASWDRVVVVVAAADPVVEEIIERCGGERAC